MFFFEDFLFERVPGRVLADTKVGLRVTGDVRCRKP